MSEQGLSTIHDKRVLFLLNPKANDGRAKKDWQRAAGEYDVLPKEPFNVTKISDLTVFLKEQSPDIIAVIGGDGTINAVCNAIYSFAKKPLVTIFPMGHGNALAYSFGVESVEKAVDVLVRQPHPIAIDVMKTSIPGYKIGVFNISVGFDARVVHTHRNYRYIGLKSYMISGVVSMIVHPEKEMTFTIDHSVTFQATASSLMIANLPVIGENFLVSENAKANDGVLDCTLFSTKYDYFAN